MNQTADSRKSNKGNSKISLFDVTKRMADIMISGIFLIALLPVFLLIAVAIKLEDGGAVIYRHNRVGKNGRPIRIFKFRTMRPDAERMKEYLSPEQLEEFQREFKLTDDPRVTKIGRFLRVTSIDELPQFLNILAGEMSLVGPRPLVEDELVEKYTDAEREKLLSVKPGLTGLWQVSGRNNCTYENRRRQNIELSYVERRSLPLDVSILLKTIVVVLRRDGAH